MSCTALWSIAITNKRVFPIDIIEADTPELALGAVADNARWLKGWSSRFELIEVPFRHQTARPCVVRLRDALHSRHRPRSRRV